MGNKADTVYGLDKGETKVGDKSLSIPVRDGKKLQFSNHNTQGHGSLPQRHRDAGSKGMSPWKMVSQPKPDTGAATSKEPRSST